MILLGGCLAEAPAPIAASGEDSAADAATDTGVDTGDTAKDTDTATDTGGKDTAVDTGDPPFSVEVFGPAEGVGATSWRGLSVGPDGAVWGATELGLLRFDGAAQFWTAAEGLLTDAPQSVLAHSDGTVWVGHLGSTERQGEQITASGEILQSLDYAETTEIAALYRLREQPHGVGAGDVWMGTDEGACLWDADLAVLQGHAHPKHPHLASTGIGFTAEGDIWNGDQYQLSRWRYSNDGDLSPTADLFEYWVPWPVETDALIATTDLDAAGNEVWVASSLYGVAKVTVGEAAGTSLTELLPAPGTATAVRIAEENVWVGTSAGLWLLDRAGGSGEQVGASWLPAADIQQIAVAADVVWLATSAGLVRVVGVPTE